MPAWLPLVLASLSPLSLAILIPALPAVALDTGTSFVVAQWTVTGFLVMVGLTQLVVGPIVDHVGCRPVLLGGLALFVAASIGCTFVTSIHWLIILRGVQGAFVATESVISRTVIQDAFDDATVARMMGYLMAVVELVAVGANPVGGYLTAMFGWKAVFMALTAVGVAMLLLALILLPETRPATSRPRVDLATVMANYRSLARNRLFSTSIIILALVGGGGIALMISFPQVMSDHFGMQADVIGNYLAANGFALMVGAVFLS